MKKLIFLGIAYLASSHVIESRGGRVLLAGAVISSNNRYDSDYVHKTKAIERQIKEEKREIQKLEKELDKILRKKITDLEKQEHKKEHHEKITAHRNRVTELQNELAN